MSALFLTHFCSSPLYFAPVIFQRVGLLPIARFGRRRAAARLHLSGRGHAGLYQFKRLQGICRGEPARWLEYVGHIRDLAGGADPVATAAHGHEIADLKRPRRLLARNPSRTWHATLQAMSVSPLLTAECRSVAARDLRRRHHDARRRRHRECRQHDAARRRRRRRRHPSRRRTGAVGRMRDAWAVATPVPPRSPAAIGSRPGTSFMRSARSGAAATRARRRCSPPAIAPRSRSRPSIASPRSPSPRSRPASTGFPPERAARIAVGTVAAEIAGAPGMQRVVFCCFSPDAAAHHRDAFAALGLG